MSGVKVQTSYLRGYAGSIDANATRSLGEIRRYCETHCKNTSGMDGTLRPARWITGQMADHMLDLIGRAERTLTGTASDLRSSATFYDQADEKSAEAVWAAADKGFWDSTGVPKNYQEKNAQWSSGQDAKFSQGATFVLRPPAEHHEAQELRHQVHGKVSWIDKIIKYLTGQDLLTKVMPIVLGDWGALRRVSEAWGQLATAFRAVGDDLSEGLSKVSSHWDSSADGRSGASRNFDYQIKGYLIPAFNEVAKICEAFRDACQFMATFYEDCCRDLIFLLNWYGKKIRKAWIALKSAYGMGLWPLLKNTTKLISALWRAIEDLIELIKTEYQKYEDLVKLLISGHEALLGRYRLNAFPETGK
ncbi:hypothetical protein [Actinomadura gamaensis]|uniref:Uncharacterized protein n=1 Tax=Actinomadura gamaensis TaxID=1763541 RepID=A0ABV9UCH8_9ACTN